MLTRGFGQDRRRRISSTGCCEVDRARRWCKLARLITPKFDRRRAPAAGRAVAARGRLRLDDDRDRATPASAPGCPIAQCLQGADGGMRAASRRWVLPTRWRRWSLLFRQRDAAILVLGRMLAADPARHAGAARRSASSTRRRARSATRWRCFDRVVALQPDDAEAHFNRGFLLQELNDHDGGDRRRSAGARAQPRPRPRALRPRAVADRDAAPRRGRRAAQEEHQAAADEPLRLVPARARRSVDLGHRDETQKILDHLQRSSPRSRAQLERETGLKATPT